MKRARFSEEQIVGILKEHEAGRKVAELAREHGVSEATLYGWKSKYGGMEVGEAQRLRSLEDENRRLKHLVADLSLDKEALKAIVRKNGWSLRRLSTKLCLRESSGSLEAGLEHGIELGKYRTDGPARSFPTALLQRGDG